MGVIGQNRANTDVTAPVGPGLQATNNILNNVRKIQFDLDAGMLRVQTRDGRWVDYQYDDSAIDTVTYIINLTNKLAQFTAG